MEMFMGDSHKGGQGLPGCWPAPVARVGRQSRDSSWDQLCPTAWALMFSLPCFVLTAVGTSGHPSR